MELASCNHFACDVCQHGYNGRPLYIHSAMASNLLVLCPPDHFSVPNVDLLVAQLSDGGFLGARLPAPNFFKPGAEFFHYITFLGCSPVVSLGEPGATAEICQIEIAAPLPSPRFFAGSNLKPARCPACGCRTTEGHLIGEAWQKDPKGHFWSCPTCAGNYSAPQLNWRRSAGFGRFFLKIWGVFEGEAVPSEHLVNLLAGETKEPWHEFYIQQLE